jgi:branched-chain amino acid transport system ATP-binding protein
MPERIAETSESGNETLLSITDLEVRYGGSIALSGISLEIRRNEFVCVVGANGAGKTTLIRTIAGMVPPHAGRVVWRGRDITSLPAWDICELGIAQVAEGRQIFPSLSVAENLLLGGSLRRAKATAARNLDRVYSLFPRLLERRRQAAGTLSGGEQQMLAIGRAVMAEPEFVMFDEPSLGLSPALTQVMFDVVCSLHAEGVTVLLVEQNVAQSLELGTRGYVLENGSVAVKGSCNMLLNDPAVRRAYLGL